MARRATHLAVVACQVRAVVQLVDSLETSRFGIIGIRLIRIGFFQSNPKRYNSGGTRFAIDTRLGRNLRFEFLHSKFDFITGRCIFEE